MDRASALGYQRSQARILHNMCQFSVHFTTKNDFLGTPTTAGSYSTKESDLDDGDDQSEPTDADEGG